MNLDDMNEYYRRREEERRKAQENGTVNAPHYTVEDAQPKAAAKHRKGGGTGRLVAIALVCALVGGAAGGLGVAGVTGALTGGGNATTLLEGERPTSVVNTAQVDTSEALTPQEIYAMYVGSCVGINAGVTTNIWGWETTSAVSGSGFVISEDGYIVTNDPVVEGASTITVTFSDGTSYDATFVGGEKDNDVAVLKIDATGLTPVVLGDSDNMLVGDPVYTIGNPLGELTYTLTDGIVSALNRTVTNEEGITMNMLQTNCTINSGNSGGPLFNQYGEVIGITSAKLSSDSSSTTATIEGLGFAIPWNDVKDIVTQLIETGTVVRPYLGIQVSTVSAEDAQRYNLPQGAYVESVEEGSAAAKAGLQVGDIITAVDDTAVASSSELVSVKNQYKPGDTAVFTLTRSGQEMTVNVTFGEDTSASTSTTDNNGQQGSSQTQPGPQATGGTGYEFPFSWGN